MANSFKRAMALTLAAAMVATAVPATNFGTISADAASYKVTGTTAPYAKTTNKYVIKGLKKGMYAKVSVTGNAKSKVTVKQGSKKIKASTKINGTGKNITLKVTNKAAAGKKYNVVVKYFNKKGKQVKKITKKATVYAQTKSVAISVNTASAVSASAITATGATIKAGTTLQLSATKTPDKNTKKITWKSSDAKVATVANGLVTGVGAGTAKITATSGKASASYEVTVEAGEVVAKITGVKQTAADKFEATFDVDASKLVDKADVIVEAADKTTVIAVKSIDFAADGKTAVVSLFSNFVDKKDYNVNYKDSKASFTASVGDVTSVVIKTTTAEQNVETPVEFALMDANGIDVTSAKDADNKVNVEFTGTYSAYTNSPALKSSITMTTIGDKATVTVKYNSAEKDAKDVVGTGEIVCVKASAVVGEPMYASVGADDINAVSKSAKFYQIATTSAALKVAEDGTDDKVFFCVKDKKSTGNVPTIISYENYEVSSSNDDVLNVSVKKDEGKFLRMSISGVKKGNAYINIKASKNGVATDYVIPVEVTKKGDISSVTLTVNKSTMSDAIDDDYYGELVAKAYDVNGKEITGDDDVTFSIDLTDDSKKKAAKDSTVAEANKAFAAAGHSGDHFNFIQVGDDNNKAWYWAPAANAGTYTFEVIAAKDGKEVKKRIDVSVRALSSSVWKDSTGTGVKLTYAIEMDTTRDAGSLDDYKTTARLYATYNNLFVGYVRNIYTDKDKSGTVGAVGDIYDTDWIPGTTGSAIISGMTFTSTEAGAHVNNYAFTVTEATIKTNEAAKLGGVEFELDEACDLFDAECLNGYKFEVINASGSAITENIDTNSAIVSGGNIITIALVSDSAVGPTWGSMTLSQLCSGFNTINSSAAANVDNGQAVLNALSYVQPWVTGGNADDLVQGLSGATAFDIESDYGVEPTTYVNFDIDEDDDIDYDEFTTVDFHYYNPADAANEFNNWIKYFDLSEVVPFEATGILDGTESDKPVVVTGGSDPARVNAKSVVKVNDESTIYDLKVSAKYGSTYFFDGDLFNAAWNGHNETLKVAEELGLYGSDLDSSEITLVSMDKAAVDDGDAYYVSGDESNDMYFARTGQYTVRFEWNVKKYDSKNGLVTKSENKESKLTLKNSLSSKVPKIEFKSRQVSGDGDSDIRDVARTSVDINNRDGAAESIVDGGLKSKISKNVFEPAIAENSKVTVKYIGVRENLKYDDSEEKANGSVVIYVPVTTTFTIK